MSHTSSYSHLVSGELPSSPTCIASVIRMEADSGRAIITVVDRKQVPKVKKLLKPKKSWFGLRFKPQCNEARSYHTRVPCSLINRSARCY